MKIRHKVIFLVGLLLVVLIAALYGVVGFVMMSGFKKVEADDADRNVSRVRDAIQNEMDSVQNSIFTWSQWDDAYQFASDRNSKFIESNVSTTLYTGMKVNFVFILNKDFMPLVQGGYDFCEGKEMKVPDSMRKWLAKESLLFSNTDPSKAFKGIIKLPEYSILAVAAPITNTAGNAPLNGYIVFVKVINEALIRNWSGITHLSIGISNTPENIKGIFMEVKGSNTIIGKTDLQDVEGNPVLNLSVTMPRPIYNQGLQSMYLLIFSVILTGLIFGFLMIFFLDKMVVKRIADLNRNVLHITENMDFSKEIPVTGNDEVSSLTKSVNGMIAAVSEVMYAKKNQ